MYISSRLEAQKVVAYDLNAAQEALKVVNVDDVNNLEGKCLIGFNFSLANRLKIFDLEIGQLAFFAKIQEGEKISQHLVSM